MQGSEVSIDVGLPLFSVFFVQIVTITMPEPILQNSSSSTTWSTKTWSQVCSTTEDFCKFIQFRPGNEKNLLNLVVYERVMSTTLQMTLFPGVCGYASRHEGRASQVSQLPAGL